MNTYLFTEIRRMQAPIRAMRKTDPEQHFRVELVQKVQQNV